jgi:hypothetical protein
MASQYGAPTEEDSRLPETRRHSLEEKVGWDFEDDVGDLFNNVRRQLRKYSRVILTK